KHIGIKCLAPGNWQSVGSQEGRQLPPMAAVLRPEKGDRSSWDAIQGDTIHLVTSCCPEEVCCCGMQVEARFVGVFQPKRINVAKKGKEISIVTPFPIAFLLGFCDEGKHDLGRPPNVLCRNGDLVRDASGGYFEMPVPRVNSWCISD